MGRGPAYKGDGVQVQGGKEDAGGPAEELAGGHDAHDALFHLQLG